MKFICIGKIGQSKHSFDFDNYFQRYKILLKYALFKISQLLRDGVSCTYVHGGLLSIVFTSFLKFLNKYFR
jgi:hypothetical protein